MLSGCCGDETPPAEPPSLNKDLVGVDQRPSPERDSVKGEPGAARGAAEIIVFAEAAMTREVARGPVGADGSFGPLEIGDNACATPHLVAAGAGDRRSAALGFDNDVEAPMASMIQTPPAIIEDSNPLFIFTCPDKEECTFECQVDEGPFEACVAPHELKGLDEGAHTFKVRAVDKAGNRAADPQSFPFDLKNQTAKVSFTKTPQALMGVGDQAHFEFVCDRGMCLFECSLDDAPYETCTSPRGLSGLLPGEHKLEVRVIQITASADRLSAVFTWQVQDKVP